MRNFLPFISFVPLVVVIFVLSFHVRRKVQAVRAMLEPLARSVGWSDVTAGGFIGTGVRGMWQRFPIELTFHNREKSNPARFVLRVLAANDLQLSIKRKFTGVWSNRPLAWFGPPVVEVHNPAAAEMWVRGDAALAERLFNDAKIAKGLNDNIVARSDQVQIDRKGLRIIRSLDTREVKSKYGFKSSSFDRDMTRYEPIAREQIALAEALVSKVATA